jgi:hypothetical protein
MRGDAACVGLTLLGDDVIRCAGVSADPLANFLETEFLEVVQLPQG